jgi:hypothetical protein
MSIIWRYTFCIGLLAVSSCGDPNASKARALQNEIQQLQRSVFEAQQAVRRLEIQVQAAKEERKKLEEEKSKAADEKSSAEQELLKLKEEFNAYKAKYNVSIRNAIPGLELKDFVMGSASYRLIKVESLDALMIKFAHSGGLATAMLTDLPNAIQDELGMGEAHERLAMPTTTLVKAKSMKGLLTEQRLDTEKYYHELKRIKVEVQEARLAQDSEENYHKLLTDRVASPNDQRIEYLRQLNLRYNQLKAKLALYEAEKVTKDMENTYERKQLLQAMRK